MYQIGNSESGEFCYVQTLKTVVKNKRLQKGDTDTNHQYLDIRFENDRLVILVETKNKNKEFKTSTKGTNFKHRRKFMIIAIGGGEVSQNQTYDIDKFIVESSKKENPNFLFIPTASKDAEAYIEVINNLYESLGCKTDTLYLSNVKVNKEEVNQKIENTDIIYVGGGNTAYMMEVWKQYSVDKALIRAYKSGKVLSGLSAGSICWFIAGHSDSEFIEGIENPKPIWVKGLGIIPYLHCPHYDEPDRVGFDEFYVGQLTDAIAIENQVAVVWDNYKMYVIKSNPNKNAYKLSWSDTGLKKEVLF